VAHYICYFLAVNPAFDTPRRTESVVTSSAQSAWLSAPPPAAQTKVSAAYGAIRRAIEEGSLAPGQHLRMTQLESGLEMSPTPIREALRLLQADGLVEHQPHRGMIVAEYTAERAEEIYRIRVALEPMATALTAERATDDELAHLAALHEQLVEAVGSESGATAVALNAEWHRAIYAACGSRYLQEFITRLWTALPVRAVWVSTRGRSSIDEHGDVMDALLARDGKLAAELMARHLTRGSLMTADRLRKRD
jgi:DNA-binding GntR family transcriptional regulator